MFRRIYALSIACAVAGSGGARADASTSGQLCLSAAATAERAHGLPNGLLRAIGMVESGREDVAGVATPWPWTLDVEGRGAFYPTRDTALTALQTALARGLGSVDVGCFQVNLAQHPSAFASLEDALDPVENADYAARLILKLHDASANWPDAVARYHSTKFARNSLYRASVLAAWLGKPWGGRSHTDDPHVVRVALSFPASRGVTGDHAELPTVIGPE